ncbi:MAG: arginine--tRNA ligase [Deltaproteobacteria bacterium]|nr:arginine--tRNA ligase [Deltaproteobacteria bacterium]
MKQTLHLLLKLACKSAVTAGQLQAVDPPPSIVLEIPKFQGQGDFSTNLAMTMAAAQKKAPRDIARIIMDHVEDTEQLLSKMEMAGPGFINFFIAPEKWYELLREVHDGGLAYGTSRTGQGKRVQIEFVSANPTGPLHVGHGRGAAVGQTLATILTAAGYEVEQEYYVNDSGRQIHTLGLSLFVRYQQLLGKSIDFPDDGYKGDYIRDLARELIDQRGENLLDVPEEEAISDCARFAASQILVGIREDLAAFGVSFDEWFSEQSLYDSGAVRAVIKDYKTKNIIYERDKALWFRTADFGDEKDRVVVRANGLTTYFASDIAYHKDKFERKFDRVIDIWGADHHGYVPRVSAAIQALGYEKERFQVLLIQLVNLLRDGKPVSMSTRSGQFVTLREVIDEVGRDAARFIFLLRHYDSPLDFDLELAKKESNENPVYYVQYVHARISNILKKAVERGYKEISWAEDFPERINLPEEIDLIKVMARYPEVVEQSARLMEPHRIPFYLKDLAGAFHAYYHDRERHQVVSDDAKLSAARLYLVSAIRIIIRNGLTLMGVSAPESM